MQSLASGFSTQKTLLVPESISKLEPPGVVMKSSRYPFVHIARGL